MTIRKSSSHRREIVQNKTCTEKIIFAVVNLQEEAPLLLLFTVAAFFFCFVFFFVSSFYSTLLIQHVFVLWAKRLHCSSTTESGRKILKDCLAGNKQANKPGNKKGGRKRNSPTFVSSALAWRCNPGSRHTRPPTHSFLLKSRPAA